MNIKYRRRKVPPDPNIFTKKCVCCEKIKKIEEFNTNASTATGYATWCKGCFSEYNKSLYLRDKELIEARKELKKSLEALNKQNKL